MSIDISNSEESLPRREREKIAHRNEIINAATRVFARKGFFNATLDEIALEAEFSKGALYSYFSNKEDLLYSILKEKSELLGSVTHETMPGENPLKEELREMFRRYAEMSFSEQDLFKLIMSLHAAGYCAFSETNAITFKNEHNKWSNYMLERVEKAIKQGEIRDISPEGVNGMIHGSVENMMMTRWDCDTVEELKENVNVFIDMLFNGIAKEREIIV